MQQRLEIAKSGNQVSRFFHTNIQRIMRASVACRIRKDKQTSSGLAAVYLQIIIDSKRLTIPMGVSWPVERFDNKAGVFKERRKGDQEAVDYNLLITKEKAKINDIFMYYRHSDQLLTVDRFKEEYSGYDTRHNFLIWIEKEINRRLECHQIDELTAQGDGSLVWNLKRFRTKIMFGEIDQYLIEAFEGWCRKQYLNHNTIHKYTKRLKVYLNLAHKSGISFNMKSVHNYKLIKPTTRIVYLKPNELELLETYYHGSCITEAQYQVLSGFLFCCYTGLRFSDLSKLQSKNVADDMLEFIMHKGRNKRQKHIQIPLISKAMGFIQNTKGLLFNTISEQKTNEHLKVIMIAAGVRKHVTTHIARHTFATQFLRKGGHIEVLKELLGHDDINSTMVYVHVDRDRLKDEMGLLA